MKKKFYTLIFLSLFLCFIFSLLTLHLGDIPFYKVWVGIKMRFFGMSDEWNPLLDERIPRIIVLLCAGAALSVSGAAMQAIFQNPLASPSVLGISTGGCLCVIIIYIYNLQHHLPFTLPLAAFSGCFLTLFLVYGYSKIQVGGDPLTRLILTGIAFSTFLLAIQGLLLYALRDQWHLIQTITEWEVGSTFDRNWNHVHMQLPLTIVGLLGCWAYRREMNILALGEEEAKNLGVDVVKIRWRLFLCISLLVGGTLASIGPMISFFALVLPHLLRRILGPDNRYLIPLCIVVGSTVLITLDYILRAFSLHFVSLGNFCAIIGGLFFLILLYQTQKRRVAF